MQWGGRGGATLPKCVHFLVQTLYERTILAFGYGAVRRAREAPSVGHSAWSYDKRLLAIWMLHLRGAHENS